MKANMITKIMKSNGMTAMARGFHKAVLKGKKRSPEILLISGIVGGVSAAVLACKASTRASEIAAEAKERMDEIHACEGMDNYSEEDKRKDTTIVYVQTGLKYAKLYAPSIGLGALSIAAILAGHNVLHKRNVALAAAFNAVDKGFKDYRGRVVERFGKELDKELRFGTKAKEFEKVVKNEETGETTVSKETVNVVNPSEHYSEYARCYDCGCTGWCKDPEANLMFLRAQENYANDKLKAQGYLFLNEVYEMLGLPRTSAGQVVGWVYDEKTPMGDNYVDFGIYNINNATCRDFVNGYERAIWLDFNVDGYILDAI